MAAEVLSCILSKIGECLLEVTAHQAGYIFRFKSKVEDLMKEDKKLTLAFERVQYDVETAERSSEEIEKDVQKWQTDVNNAIEDVRNLKEEMDANRTCLGGCFPNLAWRYRWSRKAEKTRRVMLELLESGKFTRVSRPANLPGIEFFASGDFETFESTKSTFDKVIEALREDKISMVGIHGMGGVGKTTLAKEVGKKVKEFEIFDEVVLATVSQNPSLKSIQCQIAESLSLELKEESEDTRARRLFMRLKNEKNMLIILDDVWAKIDLKSIGIPSGDDHKGIKILLTARRTHVCTTMGCQSKIPLNVLKKEEGLALFKKNAGIGDELPTLNALAKEVAGECKGLPLAIVTVGSALKGKAIDDWRLFSQKLKNSKFVDVDDVDTNIYASLKLSYDYLKDEDTKFCFLLCSLFPEDFEIPLEELVRYGRGIGLFKDANSIEEARSPVRVVVNILKASGLLLDGGKEEFVKMHDVVRDVALWISSNQEKKFMCKAGLGLTEWPMEEGLEQYAAISLMNNKLEVLPVGLECPKLEIFLLDCNYSTSKLVEVPDQFFLGMKALKVVSLDCVDVSLKSLQFLRNIRSLRLHNCTLKDISSIGALSLLEIVSFRSSLFEELPKEFGELSKLRLLDIRDCRVLKRIHSNVIQRLSQLEELYIGPNSIIWAVERKGEEMIGNASVFELNSLSHLGTLSLSIRDGWIPTDFAFPKLRRYGIIVGRHDIFLPYFAEVPMGFLGITAIRSTSLIAFKELYETLRCLELRELPELSFIWKDWKKHLSLHNLTQVEVNGCPRLRSCIFTVSLARSLVQLKVLRVSDCQNLTHIVNNAEEEEEEEEQLKDNLLDQDECGNDIVLPKLQELTLDNLKSIIAFCPQNYNLTCPVLERLLIKGSSNLGPSFTAKEFVKNLQHVEVADCDQLCDRILSGLRPESKSLETLKIGNCGEKLAFQELSLPSLKKLELESLNLPKVPAHIFKLQSLSTVKLRSCRRLRHICSTTLARNLLQLKRLYIEDCRELKQIIVEYDEKDQTSLSLTDHLQPLSFPNLSTISVKRCHKLKVCFLSP